jgi:hypothetical protein
MWTQGCRCSSGDGCTPTNPWMDDEPDSAAPPSQELDRGRPGASLAREYRRRKTNREDRIRRIHPRIGGILLALGSEPQHQRAFDQGNLAEEAVAEALEQRTAASGVVLLHNRRWPGGHGDIDHVAIGSTGVFVIDTKDVKGRVQIARPLLGKPKLLVDGRDRSRFLDGLSRQVAAVRTALDRSERTDVRVQGALCFTQAHLPLLRTQAIQGHLLIYRKALSKRLNADGPLGQAGVDELARVLADQFPPA